MSDADFDLPEYLRRIRYEGPREPTLSVLRSIIGRHTATIPFENVDVLLGRGVRLDAGALSGKLLSAGRGGYCFEQNSLFQAALLALGYQVSGLMARVVRGAPAASAATPRTHMVLLVDLPEGRYLADVGFGNLTPTGPLMLREGIEQQTPHEDYRLVPLGDEFVLEARRQAGWEHIYRFPLHRQFAIDYEVANWFTSTRPGGLFTDNLIVARPGLGSRDTLFNRLFTTRFLDGGVERRVIKDANGYRDLLCGHFGLRLTDADLAAIDAAMARRGDRGEGHPAFT